MRYFLAAIFVFFGFLAARMNIPYAWDFFDIACIALFFACFCALATDDA